MIPEIYKKIIGFESYEISNYGNVKSKNYNKERILKPSLNRGYLCVVLTTPKTRKAIKIHRLVAFYFLNNKHNKDTVNHRNGVKTDNNIENLEWCTQKENINHSWNLKLSSSKKGKEHWKAKLTEENVLSIRKNKELSIKELSVLFNASITTITRVVKNQSWKHLLS